MLAVAGAIHALSHIIAARLIVLVAVVGGIWLAWTAIRVPEPYVLIGLGAYYAGVVLPTVWLAGRK